MAGWQRQISFRNWLFEALNEVISNRALEGSNKPLLEWERSKCNGGSQLAAIEHIKENPIVEPRMVRKSNKSFNSRSNYPFNTFSVASTSTYEIRGLATNKMLGDVWAYCDTYLDSLNASNEQVVLIVTPYDLLCIARCNQNHENVEVDSFFDFSYREFTANVTIDLTATDEQIKEDFSYWLAEYKKAINFNPKINEGVKKKTSLEKKFTKRHFNKWVDHRLLPYIDIKLISAIEGIDITQDEIQKLIYKDLLQKGDTSSNFKLELKNPIKKFVEITVPDAQWLMLGKTLLAIEAQLDAILKISKT